MTHLEITMTPVHPYAMRMSALAESFPTLHGRPGVRPWNPRELDVWACGPAPGSGAKAAASFVLHVWNAHADWGCGPFDIFDAMATWDPFHRAAAVLGWLREPFWP